MNARIYKKQAKRCMELVRAWGGWGDLQPHTNIQKLRRGEDTHPILGDDFCTGTPVHWYRCSYEYDEWDTQCPRSVWIDLHYWTLVVPDDWRPDFDSPDGDLPPNISLAQRRERMSTKMLPKGWRWRGKRAIQITKDHP